jgi:hypothetical protein
MNWDNISKGIILGAIFIAITYPVWYYLYWVNK